MPQQPDDVFAGLKIAESPEQDRPRERLKQIGAGNLRLAELFAILIRSGLKGESALQAGEKLAAEFSDQLERLPEAAPAELKSIARSAGDTVFCQIMAGVELGRRVADVKRNQNNTRRISSSEDAKAFCLERFHRLVTDGAKEEFHIISLDTKNQMIASHQISVGTLDASLVHPREVFRPAIKDAASSILLIHNHPSGDPTPSKQDLDVTRRLQTCGETLGIDVLDHIVVAASGAVSIRECS